MSKKIMFLLVLIILVIPSVTKATLEENLANELEVLEMNNIEIVETSVNEDGDLEIILEPTKENTVNEVELPGSNYFYPSGDYGSSNGKVDFFFTVPANITASVYIENRTTVPFWAYIDLTNMYGINIRNVYRRLFTEWGTDNTRLNSHGNSKGYYRFSAENLAGYDYTVRVKVSNF